MQKTFEYSLVEMNYLTKKHLLLRLAPKNEIMQFEAGQYLSIKYPNGEFLPFSIANAPRPTGEIELHIRVSAEDIATQAFIFSLTLSGSVLLTGPFGDSKFENKPGSLLLLAAGTGFAPSKAIIEEMTKKNIERECYFYWTVRTEDDFYLKKVPDEWQTKMKNFHFVPIVTGKEGIKKSILDYVKEDFTDFSSCSVYVFGPSALARDTLHSLSELGLKKENFYTDVPI